MLYFLQYLFPKVYDASSLILFVVNLENSLCIQSKRSFLSAAKSVDPVSMLNDNVSQNHS